MVKARHATVSLSPIREEQLRKIAQISGLSPREQVEQWIRTKLREMGADEKGCPYLAPPGFSVTPFILGKVKMVCLMIEGLPLTLLALNAKSDPQYVGSEHIDDTPEAEAFAEGLDWSAEVNKPWEYEGTKYGGRYIYIARQGAAVTIRIDEARKALTPSLAQDLAEAVREVMRRAENLRGKVAEAAQKPPAGISPAEFRAACEVTW